MCVNGLMQQEDCFATSCIDVIYAIVFLYMTCVCCHVMLKIHVKQTQRLSVSLCMSACRHSRSINNSVKGQLVQAVVVI